MEKSKREKNKYLKELIIMSILLAVIGLTISYATVNATLNIAGVSSFNVASWDVRFISADVIKQTGDVKITQSPKFSGLNVNYEVHLQKPGDSVTIEAIVKNSGTMNAKLQSLYPSGIPTEYEDNIAYIITDENEKPLETNKVLMAQTGDTMKVHITIKYKENIYGEKDEIKTFNLGLGLNFVQV